MAPLASEFRSTRRRKGSWLSFSSSFSQLLKPFCFRQKWEVMTFNSIKGRAILFIHPAFICGPLYRNKQILNVRKPAGRGGERHKMGNDYRLRSNFHSLECETSGFTSLLPPIHMEVSEPAGNPNASKLQQKNVLLFYLLLSERTAPAQHQGR